MPFNPFMRFIVVMGSHINTRKQKGIQNTTRKQNEMYKTTFQKDEADAGKAEFERSGRPPPGGSRGAEPKDCATAPRTNSTLPCVGSSRSLPSSTSRSGCRSQAGQALARKTAKAVPSGTFSTTLGTESPLAPRQRTWAQRLSRGGVCSKLPRQNFLPLRPNAE